MALIQCPECSKEVSDKSISCPSCGYPIHHDMQALQQSKPVKDPVVKSEKPCEPKAWAAMNKGWDIHTIDLELREIPKYLELKAFERPGYTEDENTIHLPVLFAKINHFDGTLQKFLDSKKWRRGNVLKFNDANISAIIKTDREPHDTHGSDPADVLLKQMPFMKQPYRRNILMAVSKVMASKDTCFTNLSQPITEESLLSIIAHFDDRILMAMNQTDYQMELPVIMVDVSEKYLDEQQSIALFLLSMIGFDVLIMNTQGKADIENFISLSMLHCFYADRPQQTGKPTLSVKSKAIRKTVLVGAVLIIGVGLVIGSVFYFMNHFYVCSGKVGQPTSKPMLPVAASDRLTTNSTGYKYINQGNVKIIDAFDKEGNPIEIQFNASIERQDLVMNSIGLLGQSIWRKMMPGPITLNPGVYGGYIEYAFGGNQYHRITQPLLIIDGNQKVVNYISVDEFQFDLVNTIRNGVSEMYGARLVFTDLQGSNVMVFSKRDKDYYEVTYKMIAKNVDTGKKSILTFSNRNSFGDLPDGNYTFEFMNEEPFTLMNIKKNNTVYHINNTVISKQTHKNNNPIQVKEGDSVLKFHVGDSIVIDMANYFTDKDHDPLTYSVATDTRGNMSNSFVFGNYVEVMNKQGEFAYTFYANDQNGSIVGKNVKIIVD